MPAPLQFSCTSQGPCLGRQIQLAGWNASAGQAALAPLQVSASSQAPAVGRQVKALPSTAQVPLLGAPAVVLQAWQSCGSPAPQAVSQHTPSTQKPDWQSEPAPQLAPGGLPAWATDESALSARTSTEVTTGCRRMISLQPGP
jgi:hypothetical protein